MQLEVGSIVEGKVTGITRFGAFVELAPGKTGMVHISEVSTAYVNDINEYIKEGQIIRVRILNVSDDGKISLSIKRAVEQPQRPAQPQQRRPQQQRRPSSGYSIRPSDSWTARKSDNLSFEDMMSRFKHASDDKMSDLKRIMDVKKGSGRRGQHR